MKSMKTKKIKKSFEAMKSAKCQWPNCEKKNKVHCSLPLLDIKDDQVGLRKDDGSLVVPFCDYHSLVVMSGGMFGIMEGKDGNTFYGPTKVFDISRIVVEAMVLSGELKKLVSNYDKVQYDIKEKIDQKKKL